MAILVVDDEPTQMDSIAKFLFRQGHEVVKAPNGKEALALLDQHGPGISLVILDYLMPDITGLEVLENIRQRSYSPPVILATAYADKFVMAKALSRQYDGFLEKPFTPDQLYNEIKRILKVWTELAAQSGNGRLRESANEYMTLISEEE